MSVRKAAPDDWRQLRRLARAPFKTLDEIDAWSEQLFVYDRGDGRLGGYISVSERPWTVGSNARPVAHVEAWFVVPSMRRSGIGAELMRAAEQWARLKGHAELCSDTDLDNHVGLAAHEGAGFEPSVRLQYFRKPIVQAASRVPGQG